MQICPEGEIAGEGGGGGCDGKDERLNKETNNLFFMYLLQKNTFDVHATTKYVSIQPPVFFTHKPSKI